MSHPPPPRRHGRCEASREEVGPCQPFHWCFHPRALEPGSGASWSDLLLWPYLRTVKVKTEPPRFESWRFTLWPSHGRIRWPLSGSTSANSATKPRHTPKYDEPRAMLRTTGVHHTHPIPLRLEDGSQQNCKCLRNKTAFGGEKCSRLLSIEAKSTTPRNPPAI